MAKEPKTTEGRRQHKATYAKDKKKGGYLVRVLGPCAAEFAGREVPVTRKDDSESMEKLSDLIWSGIDTGTDEHPGTGKPVALYKFEPKPKGEAADELPF